MPGEARRSLGARAVSWARHSPYRAVFVAAVALAAIVAGAGLGLALTGLRDATPASSFEASASTSPDASVAEASPSLSATVVPSATPTLPQPSIVSPSPSPSTATTSPTPTPGPVVDAPEAILPPNSLVEVTAGSIEIRQLASVGVHSPLLATVPRGEVLHIRDWNTPESLLMSPMRTEQGLVWYRVDYVPGVRDWPTDARRADRIRGFAAIEAVSGQRFVELLAPRCPDAFDTTTLTAITPWERLTCIGDRQITLEGTYGCGACEPFRRNLTATPEWFVSQLAPVPDLLSPVGQVGELGVTPIQLAWGADARPSDKDHGSILRVTGQFNDPRSTDCAFELGFPQTFRLDELAAEWYCREIFVVRASEAIGRDDAYPSAP